MVAPANLNDTEQQRLSAVHGDLPDEEMWQAVLDRDGDYDGVFVYAVRTTGVYCPPSCVSRRPKTQNVAFYSDAGSAEAAGFRPCRRCRENARVVEDAIRDKVVEAVRLIEAPSETPPTLEELGRAVGLSPTHLQRMFKRVLGISPHMYGDGVRMDRFRTLLHSGSDVLSAAYEAGFGAPSRAYDKAIDHLGMTPGAYRSGASGIEIRYTVTRTTLGMVVVAATNRGVCLVRLDDDEIILETGLREEFPRAKVLRDDERLKDWTDSIVGYLEGLRDWPLLPIDVQGSAFQRSVWDVLRRIPQGQTVTYSQLADMLGSPRGARAVAQACARNPVALVVPCHRVVPKNGGVGGYRWGSQRKVRLLEMEAGTAQPSGQRSVG